MHRVSVRHNRRLSVMGIKPRELLEATIRCPVFGLFLLQGKQPGKHQLRHERFLMFMKTDRNRIPSFPSSSCSISGALITCSSKSPSDMDFISETASRTVVRELTAPQAVSSCGSSDSEYASGSSGRLYQVVVRVGLLSARHCCTSGRIALMSANNCYWVHGFLSGFSRSNIRHRVRVRRGYRRDNIGNGLEGRVHFLLPSLGLLSFCFGCNSFGKSSRIPTRHQVVGSSIRIRDLCRLGSFGS